MSAPRGKDRQARSDLPRISGRTKVIAVIGDPVAHSLSPAMHNAAFTALGLDYVYVAFHVTTPRLRAAVAAVRTLGIRGLNVTVPHKEKILPLLDSVSEQARRVGAVNTVVQRRGRLHGDNTDVEGFLRALRDTRFVARGARVLIVGAGGAARAVVVGLVAKGARSILLANRTPSRARRLARQLGGRHGRVEVVNLGALTDPARLKTLDLVVNTTSIGWHAERFPPLTYDATPPACLFVDLVYGKQTDFLRRAAIAGRPARDGTAMLLEQGACAFGLWTGRRAPLACMRAALEPHIH